MLNIETAKLKTLLPFGGAILIFWGVLKLTIYYNAFNIQINSFLEFSEIITAFLNDIIYISFLIFIVSFFDFITTSTTDTKESNNYLDSYILENNFKRRLKMAFKKFSIILVINIVLLIIYLIMKFVKKSHDGYALESLIILDFQIIIGVLLFEYKRRHFLFYGKKLSPSVSNLILYFIIITLMLINTTIDEIRNVKNNKKYLNTSFVTTKAEIISDSFHYFIGKTKNYLFFYDEKLNKTIIYPMTEIKQLNFAR